jgi:hypothetical protein
MHWNVAREESTAFPHSLSALGGEMRNQYQSMQQMQTAIPILCETRENIYSIGIFFHVPDTDNHYTTASLRGIV